MVEQVDVSPKYEFSRMYLCKPITLNRSCCMIFNYNVKVSILLVEASILL